MKLSEQIGIDFKRAVENTDEFAQEVVYTKYEDNSTLPISIIQEQLEYKDIHNEGRTINDNSVIFAYLEFTPSIYDFLTIDSQKWVIDGFSGKSSKYRLEVSKDTVKTHKHTQGRFR